MFGPVQRRHFLFQSQGLRTRPRRQRFGFLNEGVKRGWQVTPMREGPSVRHDFPAQPGYLGLYLQRRGNDGRSIPYRRGTFSRTYGVYKVREYVIRLGKVARAGYGKELLFKLFNYCMCPLVSVASASPRGTACASTEIYVADTEHEQVDSRILQCRFHNRLLRRSDGLARPGHLCPVSFQVSR